VMAIVPALENGPFCVKTAWFVREIRAELVIVPVAINRIVDQDQPGVIEHVGGEECRIRSGEGALVDHCLSVQRQGATLVENTGLIHDGVE